MFKKKEFSNSIALTAKVQNDYGIKTSRDTVNQDPTFEIHYVGEKFHKVNEETHQVDEGLLVDVNCGDDKFRVNITPNDASKLLKFLKTK